MLERSGRSLRRTHGWNRRRGFIEVELCLIAGLIVRSALAMILGSGAGHDNKGATGTQATALAETAHQHSKSRWPGDY
jgi:hypothetical protein